MIDVSRDNGLWRVVLNRPEKANSLTGAMLEQLCAVAQDARDRAKVLILTGAGKVFSAGADLDEARAGLATSDLWEQLSGDIAALPCLTIAALNGTLAGGAFGMALACDLRVAVPDARFFYPVMRLGFLPQPSDPVRLRRLVGPARAKMILMAGQKITAPQALDWGLIDQMVQPDELDNAVADLSGDVMGASGAHAAAIKGMVEQGKAAHGC